MVYAGIGILLLIVIWQTAIIWKYQRQVKDICRQLAFLTKHDSNMLITKEFEQGGIGELAELLNEILSSRRKERKAYLEKEKMISDTYTNLSHDIRTPLTSLDGYFQLLEDSTDENEQRRYIGIIQERISSLKDMLEELFTFTKLKNESYQLELSRCCVNRILKDTVFSYYEEWMAKEITPQIEIPEEELFIQGNPQAFRRVIQNVIKNGLEHGEKTIKIQLSKKNGKIILKVSNHIAHPEQIDIECVFERFYKADEARNRNSTGLGLSIAKELILRMNGEIRASLEKHDFCIEISIPMIE